jgi:UDP-glucose 4-epimerase
MTIKESILITGANGLLASRLLQANNEKFEVHALVHKEPQKRIAGVTYYLINFSTDWSTSQLPKNMYAVLHLAQSSRYKEFPEQALDIFKVNTDSTAKLLDYSARVGVAKFIYFSTGGLYVSSNKLLDETSSLMEYNYLNYHFASKFSGEVLTNTYSSQFLVTIFRPFFIYGKGQRRSMLLPRLVEKIKSGTPIVIEGLDGLRINPIHVDDACKVVSKVIENEHFGLFNLAGPDVLSLKSICEKIGFIVGKTPVFEYVDRQPADLVASTEKISQFLYKPVISLDQGLEDILYE